MKICYIGSFQHLFDEEGIARSLEKLGVKVLRFEEQFFTKQDLDEIRLERPDFVLFAKLKISDELRPEVLKLGKTICWIPDLYFGLPRAVKIANDVMFKADYVFTPDGGHDAEFKANGINHHLLRQGIYDEECYTGDAQQTNFKIVFVGGKSPHSNYRQRLMHALSERYGRLFNWIGKQYTFTVRGRDLNNLFASVPIIIGDSFYSQHYWSNRIYETLGRGGFMIHPHIEGLGEEFAYYKHFVPYDIGDFEGLFEKIEYYLEHDKEREYIRMEGQQYVKDNYTLMQRCQQLLKYIS